ncbi:hypothetical protein NKH28_26035 [Mesorhizobium sp. M1227]|uniref:hypothetical protein n=1 Tax=Mesorhizobium sp. M1227 TaxID=2957071 RepID=UPI003336DB15
MARIRIGRGAGVCSELASRDRFAAFQPRLVIKSRVVKLDGKGLQRARAQSALYPARWHSIASPRELYDPEDGTTSDRHQFSFIFSAEAR